MSLLWTSLLLALTAFAPAMQDGAPLPPSSQASDAPSASPPPAQHADSSMKPPVLLHNVNPHFSKQAEKEHVSGSVELKLTIDEKGLPQDVHVVRSVGHGLDEQAILAVNQYRFAPATKNGVPVPVVIFINVNFEFR